MQSKQNLIFCSQHPDCLLNRIDPDPNCSQQAYCAECLLHMQDGPEFYKKLVTFSSFINTSPASFVKQREKIITSEQPEKAYLDVLTRKDESLNTLSAYLTKQKEKTNRVYDELKLIFTTELEKFRQGDLQKLDQELEKMSEFYGNLEKTLNRAFPMKEGLDKMFPSIEDMQKKVEGINEPAELQKFVHKIKQEISEGKFILESGLHHEDLRKELFDSLIQKFKEEELKRPTLTLRLPEAKLAKAQLETYLGSFLKSLFSFENYLVSPFQAMSPSKFANFQDLQIIQKWLPDGYNFYPKLLYRASKHGLTNDKFHNLCDEKGPTITLIHCLFDGAKEPTVVGGFLDQSWNSYSGVIKSEKAFLFSLSSKIKCPLRKNGIAAFGNFADGPIFCGPSNYELVVNSRLKAKISYFVMERHYHGTAKLVNVESWNGEGRKDFKLLDYEVFAVDQNASSQ